MLPIEAILARSAGVDIRNRGDFDEGEAVSSLAICTGGVVVVVAEGGGGAKGRGNVCDA